MAEKELEDDLLEEKKNKIIYVTKRKYKCNTNVTNKNKKLEYIENKGAQHFTEKNLF